MVPVDTGPMKVGQTCLVDGEGDDRVQRVRVSFENGTYLFYEDFSYCLA